MYKKKILFIIGSFKAGGAEKSIVSQLQCFDPNLYDISAYVFQNTGLFRSLLPSYVKVLQVSDEVNAIYQPLRNHRFFIKHPVLFVKKLYRTIFAKLFHGKLAFPQKQWQLWKRDIPMIPGMYDIAVGHQQGITNYIVIDKTDAIYKNLWIHTLYSKRRYDYEFDEIYYKQATSIITISEICRQDLVRCIPSQKDKYVVIPNIVNDRLIKQMACEAIDEDFFATNKKTIITVARLSYPKGIDRAVNTAKVLKDEGLDFLWLVIGEGPLRQELQQMINGLKLEDNFILVGLRSNPYKYIARADIAVQPSDYEGKSIFADEAKILGKIFVSTNYETVYDQITDEENGIITEKDPSSLAKGIIKGLTDSQLQVKISSNLKKEPIGNTSVIQLYYNVYEGRF